MIKRMAKEIRDGLGKILFALLFIPVLADAQSNQALLSKFIATLNSCSAATQFVGKDFTCHSGLPGTITSITGGTGITGGTITTTGTFAIDEDFSPMWTGVHIFKGGGGTGTSVSVGTTGAQGILCVGNSTCNSNPTSGDPPHTFEIVDNGGGLQGIRLMTYASGAAAITPLHWSRADGTQSAPTALISGDNIMSIGARGYNGSAMSQSAIAIEGFTAENWSTSNNGSDLQFQTTPIGASASSRATVLDLQSLRSLFSNELEVQTTGEMFKLITTTAHGGGQNYLRFSDPSANMGYIGFASSDNTMYVDNILVGDLHLKTNDTDRVIINSTGGVTFPSISTTASAANAFLDSANNNNLLRSTSSIRYKQDVRTLDVSTEVLKLRPVRYRSKAAADDPKLWWYGLIAEEVAQVDPRLIFTDKQGRPDGVQYDRIGVLTLGVVQRQERELHWLWLAVGLLTAWNFYLTFRRRA